MDPIKNPFAPGAGSPPPELVGRDPILSQARVLLGRVKAKKSEKSMLLTGLRGVGKTVLLNEIERIASSQGYRTIAIEAHEDKTLGRLIAPYLRTVLYDLDRAAGVGDKVKRGLAVLRSFIGSLKVEVGDVSFGLDIDPEKGTADSGDIEIDLPNLFVAVAEAAEERKNAVAVLIDEVQYFNQKELGALIMAMHKVQQRQLPLVLLGAGLPILPGLAGESKSYAERLFNFPDIGALSKEDAAKALREPAQAAGVVFEAPALAEVFRLTKGYPYFLQEWGYQSWNLAQASPITQPIVEAATEKVIPRLDQNFFRVRFDRLTPSEKNFLRAIAGLGSGPQRTGDIADALRVKISSLGPVRAKLIKKGMIYSPAHGDIAFTVPLFNEFMLRVIPQFKP
ncbi:MAG: ATP-binding protein [Verrucomicrobiales bacterium]|nr:ATP-binding protein [Verrucomicrobiales bacterium]